jgi:hypothetical protein
MATEWVDAVVIYVAVIIVILVTSLNNYWKGKQFATFFDQVLFN